MVRKEFKLFDESDRKKESIGIYHGVTLFLENNDRYEKISTAYENNNDYHSIHKDRETGALIYVEWEQFKGNREPVYLNILSEEKKINETIKGIKLAIPKFFNLEKIIEGVLN